MTSDKAGLPLEQLTTKELTKLLKELMAIDTKPMEYVPHPKQEGFHRSDKMITMAICGNRAGKSEAGAKEVVWRMLGTHPYKKCKVPIKVWAGAFNLKNVNKILWKKIRSHLEDRHLKRVSKNSEGIVDHVELINGSTLDFKTYKQDSMAWESEDIDLLWLDEPPKREHYTAAMRGLIDRGGHVIITATPLREPWVYEELWQPGMEGHPDISCHQWSSYDNPHTDHKALKRFEMSLSPEDRKVRIYGEFKQLIGRVLKSFRRQAPSVIRAYDWPRDKPYIEGLDPHLSKPHGLVRVGVLDEETLVVFHASRPSGTMEELAHHVKNTRPPGTEPAATVADTSLGIYDQNMHMTMQDRLAMFGVPTTLAYKMDRLLPGLELLDEMTYRATTGEGKRVYVMDSCELLIDEMMRLRWSDKKDEVPVGDDDLVDPLRYVVDMDPWSVVGAGRVLPTRPVTYVPQQEKQANGFVGKSFDFDEDEEDDEEDGLTFEVRY